MELLTSAVITAPHGFSTRRGGRSRGLFAQSNCSFSVGDQGSDVQANLSALALAAQVAPGNLMTATQVHGVAVIDAPPANQVRSFEPLAEADGLIARHANTAVGVRTADCLPILIEAGQGAVAAVHAGWRGVLDDIVSVAVKRLGPGPLSVAIGPCIRACCFEVDLALAQRFAQRFGPSVVVPVLGREKPHLDLPRAVRNRLVELGVSHQRIDVGWVCTMCDARFFSHRRDAGVTGRQLSFITAGPTPL